MFQIITIVGLRWDLPRLPLRVFIDELLKLGVCHEIFVDEKTLESYFVLGNGTFEQLTDRYRE